MKRFLISAGEASGDTYGAQLVTALRSRLPDAEFFGVGGTAMRGAGCETVVDARDVAVVGLAEVLTHLPKIYERFHHLLRTVDEREPDAAILIDFPDFNFRLARQLHKRGIPVFYFVSPQLWAWRQGRIKLVRQYVRKMLVIFPFEEKFYSDHGVKVTYVGHPLAELPLPAISRETFAAENGLNTAKPWIALLPGSRRKEVALNLPGMVEAAASMGGEYEYVLPVASTLDADWMRGIIDRGGSGPGRAAIKLTHDARASLVHARAAVVASGTATLEAALLGTPFVMVYRLAPLTWLVGRRLVNVPYYSIVNLIMEREVITELVQHRFSPDRVATEMNGIVHEGMRRAAMLEGFDQLRQKLQSPPGSSAALRAADEILLSMCQPS